MYITGERISYDATSDVQMQVRLHRANELAAGAAPRRPGNRPISSRRRRKARGGWACCRRKRGTVDLVPSAALSSLLRAAKWRKSRHSNPSGNCVEMARLPGQRVAVRDSRRPEGPALLFSRVAWEAFLHDLREGAIELARSGPTPVMAI